MNVAAPGEEEGSGDPDSPSDLTDWSSTLEPSGTPQMYEDPTITDPAMMGLDVQYQDDFVEDF